MVLPRSVTPDEKIKRGGRATGRVGEPKRGERGYMRGRRKIKEEVSVGQGGEENRRAEKYEGEEG